MRNDDTCHWITEGNRRDRRVGQHQHRSAVQAAAVGVARAALDDRHRPGERGPGAGPQAGSGDQPRGRGLAARARREAGPGVRGHQCLRAPRRRAALRRGGHPRHRPDAGRGRARGDSACQPARAPRRAERQHGDLRRAGHHPDGVRGESRVVDVPYAEIVASVSSASAGPGTRANIDEFTKTTSRGVEVIGGARRGKAIIILNPADPPMIMRDTIFCAIPEDADQDAITKSIKEVVAEVQTYVPGYRLLNEPQFDPPSVHSGGQALVTTFVEVEGAGDYLPPYAGNLDIMTAAATKVGEEIAKERASAIGRSASMTDEIFFNPIWDVRMTDTSLRDGSHHKRHQFTADEVRFDRRRAGRRGRAGHRGHPRRRARRVELQLRLLQDPRAGTDQAGRRDGQGVQDRLPDAARSSAPRTTSRRRRTTAARSAASPPTAPRPTCRSSTSGWPANSASRPSAS